LENFSFRLALRLANARDRALEDDPAVQRSGDCTAAVQGFQTVSD
jgi:hypothetical protein